MAFEKTATRLWKRLTPAERASAAGHFWQEPDEESLGSALGAIVNARHLRPQVARKLPTEAKVKALASVLDLGEGLAASLLAALHLGERRSLLVAFLDAVGLAHEDGILKDEPPPQPLSDAAAAAGARALAAAFPGDQVRTYLNTLWLQDPDRWRSLEGAAERELG